MSHSLQQVNDYSAITSSRALPNPRDNGSSVQFISFVIGNDHYGVDIMAVREIKEWSEITHLPRQPQHVRGVVNLRGVIIPIVDLQCRFGQGLTAASPLHIIIIVQIAEQLVGLLADRVLDIVSFDQSIIKPVPKVAQSSLASLLAGIVTVEGALIALIDLRNLLWRPGASDGSEASIPQIH